MYLKYKITWSFNGFDTDKRNVMVSYVRASTEEDAKNYWKNYLINRGLEIFWIDKVSVCEENEE